MCGGVECGGAHPRAGGTKPPAFPKKQEVRNGGLGTEKGSRHVPALVGGKAAPSGSRPPTPPASPCRGKKSLFRGGDGEVALGLWRSARCAAGQRSPEHSEPSEGRTLLGSDRAGSGPPRFGAAQPSAPRGNGRGAAAAMGAEPPLRRCRVLAAPCPGNRRGCVFPGKWSGSGGRGWSSGISLSDGEVGQGAGIATVFAGSQNKTRKKKKANPTQSRSEK